MTTEEKLRLIIREELKQGTKVKNKKTGERGTVHNDQGNGISFQGKKGLSFLKKGEYTVEQKLRHFIRQEIRSMMNEGINQDWYDATVTFKDPRSKKTMKGKVVRTDNGVLTIKLPNGGTVKKQPSELTKVNEGKGKGDGSEYKAFFNKTLKSFNVTNVSDLSDKQKQAFYDKIDAGWKGDKEND